MLYDEACSFSVTSVAFNVRFNLPAYVAEISVFWHFDRLVSFILVVDLLSASAFYKERCSPCLILASILFLPFCFTYGY